ncbi:hypothetical protein, partial [Demequina lignilytica]
GGVAVGAHLRAEGVAEGLVVRAHRRRTRRTLASAAASVAVLALAGTVAVELLRPAPDPAGPVHRDDVPSIDRIVNPEAADLFQCGVEPTELPDQGVTIADDADRDAHPDVEVALFAQYTSGGSEAAERLEPDGSVPLDPDAGLAFAATVDWDGEVAPADSGVSTAAALLDGSGAVVALHDGVTVRGDLLPVVDRTRAVEGAISPYVCGEEALAEGEYSAVVVVQVWQGDPTNVIATYVNPGLGDRVTVRVEDTGTDLELAADDEVRRLQADFARRVEASGQLLLESQSGSRAPVLLGEAWSRGTASCLRAASAPDLGSLKVFGSLGVNMADKRFGTVEILEGAEAGVWPGIWWPRISEWSFGFADGLRSPTILLYDSSGALVAVYESNSTINDPTDADGGEWWTEVGFQDPGCAVPSELPTEPGRYTPVFVYDLTETSPGYAADGWFLLPPFEYDGDPASLESGLSVDTAASGLLVIL